VTRLRLRFTKLGKVRFTSHRDVARMWERALRRARLPVARSGGYSPRPRIAFGLALSTGHSSVAEYLDVSLAADAPAAVEELPALLSPELPFGIDVTAAGVVAADAPSLQEAVTSCGWRIVVPGVDPRRARDLVEGALGADRLVVARTRKGRHVTDDLRPAVVDLSVAGPDPATGGTELHAELAVHPRSVRPAELLRALSPEDALPEGPVLRTAQWIWRDGAREEPLVAAPDATARHQEEAPSASRRDLPDARRPTPGPRSRDDRSATVLLGAGGAAPADA
jgi:radical SAM-linked protein